jgi:hypothetical protein
MRRAFVWTYLPSATICLAVVSACSMRETLCLDYDFWTFHNATPAVVRVTPLYSGSDGSEHVVPRDGWQQTEFQLAPDEERDINLETGDFPFDRVLVESEKMPAWILPVEGDNIAIRDVGPRATPAQLAAKIEPSLRRFKLYVATVAFPLLWTLPVLLLVWWVNRSRTAIVHRGGPGG